MATQTSAVNCRPGSKSGGQQTQVTTPAGTPDLVVTINTDTVKLRGQFLELCKTAADQMSGILK